MDFPVRRPKQVDDRAPRPRPWSGPRTRPPPPPTAWARQPRASRSGRRSTRRSWFPLRSSPRRRQRKGRDPRRAHGGKPAASARSAPAGSGPRRSAAVPAAAGRARQAVSRAQPVVVRGASRASAAAIRAVHGRLTLTCASTRSAKPGAGARRGRDASDGEHRPPFLDLCLAARARDQVRLDGAAFRFRQDALDQCLRRSGDGCSGGSLTRVAP